MKYYSEVLHKTFDNEKECLKAEETFAEQQKKEVAAKKAEEEALSKTKKELAKAIEEADKAIDEANKLYDVAQDEAAKILEESNKQVTDILEAARGKVAEAHKQKLEAVRAFNEKFGAYTTTVTGQKAVDEFRRSVQRLDSVWRSFWSNLF